MTLLARSKAAPRFDAINPVWKHPGIAGDIVRAEFFDAEPTINNAKYLGPSMRFDRYLGNRTDPDMFLGIGTLFP